MSATSETTQDYVRAHHGHLSTSLTQEKVALFVGALGTAITLAGAIAFVFRIKLAQLLLDARIWFNMPLTEADATKVLFMTIQIVQVIAWGAFTAGAAFLFAIYKWTKGQPR